MGKRHENKQKLYYAYMRACYKMVEDAMSAGDFASLQDVRFWKSDEGEEPHVPDYSNPTTIAYYQLRYASSYAFEYYCIYRMALKWLELEGCSDVSAVSLGCGSGLDKYSLELAIDDLGFGDKCYLDTKDRATGEWKGDVDRWVGVDISPWGDIPVPRDEKRDFGDIGFPSHKNAVRVLPNGATEYFTDLEGKECQNNVFYFPRILSELDDDVTEELADAIRKTRFTEDRIVVCIANRVGIKCAELENAAKVLRAFGEAGYTMSADTPDEVVGAIPKSPKFDVALDIRKTETTPLCRIVDASSRKDVPITDFDVTGFILPWDIRDALRETDGKMAKPHENCPSRLLCDECVFRCEHAELDGSGTKKCPLAKNPVSTTSQMNFQIVLLKR